MVSQQLSRRKCSYKQKYTHDASSAQRNLVRGHVVFVTSLSANLCSRADDRNSPAHAFPRCRKNVLLSVAPSIAKKHRPTLSTSFHQTPSGESSGPFGLTKMNLQHKAVGTKTHTVLCSKHFESECFTARTQISTVLGLKYKPMPKPDAVCLHLSTENDVST